jgi:hypothetical protein
VATATLPPAWRAAATCFVAEDQARIWLVPTNNVTAPEARARVLVLDLAAGGRTRTAPFALTPSPDVGGFPRVLPDGRGGRLLIDHGRLELREGATGSLLATLAEEPGRRSAAFTRDGRVVVVDATQHPVRLRVFDPSGSPAAETNLELSSAPPLRLGPEVAPGRVTVVAGTYSSAGAGTLVVDLATLEVVERLEGLVPALFSMGDASSPVRPGGSVHFFLGRGLLMRIDFATGERKVVAGPGAPEGERLSVR